MSTRGLLPLALLPAAAALAFAARAVLAVPGQVDAARGPGAAARTVGAADDIRLRQSLLLGHRAADAGRTAVRLRSRAETALAVEATHDAGAANLLGALTLLDAGADPANASRYVGEAASAFQAALRVDPRSEEAKYNLELLLTLEPRAANRASTEQTRGKFGKRGKGANGPPPKTGY
jgi:hypothetical protein